MYESNYLKLQKLLGDDFDGLKDGVSLTERDCDLHLNVLKRDRYTTTFRLTYWFEPGPADHSLCASRKCTTVSAT